MMKIKLKKSLSTFVFSSIYLVFVFFTRNCVSERFPQFPLLSAPTDTVFTSSPGVMWHTTKPPRDFTALTILPEFIEFKGGHTTNFTPYGFLNSKRLSIFKDILNGSVIFTFSENQDLLAMLEKIHFQSEGIGLSFDGYVNALNLVFFYKIPFMVSAGHNFASQDVLDGLSLGKGDYSNIIDFISLSSDDIDQFLEIVKGISFDNTIGDAKIGVLYKYALPNIGGHIHSGFEIIANTKTFQGASKKLSFDPSDNFSSSIESVESLIVNEQAANFFRRLILMTMSLADQTSESRGSLGFGSVFHFYAKPTKRLSGMFSTQLIYFLSHPEYRLILQYVDVQRSVLRAEPGLYRVDSNPGMIGLVSLATRFHFDNKKTFLLGYNFYWQNSEVFSKVFTSSQIQSNLMIERAVASSCIAHRVFAQYEQKVSYLRTHGSIKLGVGTTLHRQDCGDLSFLALGIELNF